MKSRSHYIDHEKFTVYVMAMGVADVFGLGCIQKTLMMQYLLSISGIIAQLELGRGGPIGLWT